MEVLRPFLTDDQILEVADFAFSGRTLEAAKRLQYLLLDKWTLSIIDAVTLVRNLVIEFST